MRFCVRGQTDLRLSRHHCGGSMEHTTFAALDFETANQARDSACSLGLVLVDGGRISARQNWLIRPPSREFQFTHIHGITWDMVRSAPSFREVWLEARELLRGAEFLAAHNAAFDRSVLTACCSTAGLSIPALEFRCSMLLARKVLGIRPADLETVTSRLRIPLKHHDALSDAEACARIVMAATSGGGVRGRVCGRGVRR
jgi:DNA polymerase-3 subunit epsilon